MVLLSSGCILVSIGVCIVGGRLLIIMVCLVGVSVGII